MRAAPIHPGRRAGRLTLSAVALVGLVALAGCGGGSSVDSNSKGQGTTIAKVAASGAFDCSKVTTGGTFTLGVTLDVVSFDPPNTQDNGSLWADMNVYDQLVRLSPDAKKIEPGLATKWTTSNGGRTYTFSLRDAKFSDGTPVTASDVKFSWDRARSPKALANFALAEVTSTKVVDAHTFQATLNKPWAPFLNDATLWPASIISEKAYKKLGPSFKTHPVGSGPFSVESMSPGQQVVLKRNPYWWDKDACGKSYPYLDKVVLKYMPNDNTRVTGLQGGQLDAITDVPYNQISTLDAAPGLTAAVTPQLGVLSMSLSQTVPAFRDTKVVQAINFALDRKAIIKSVFYGNGTPGTSPVVPGVYFHTDKYGYAYDLAKAKTLMAASKFPKGFKVTFTVPAGDSVASAIATIMQSELKQIGVDLAVESLDSTSINSRLQAGKLQVGYYGGTSDNLEPNSNALFCCVSDGGAKSAYTGWVDKSADALFHQTQTELDTTKRGQLYDQWQKVIMEKGPFIWLLNPTNRFAYHDNVGDFFLQSTAHYDLWLAWKK
jgi:peptide/nickel transport system substrate-binding protein